jgi:hypothetical protein
LAAEDGLTVDRRRIERRTQRVREEHTVIAGSERTMLEAGVHVPRRAVRRARLTGLHHRSAAAAGSTAERAAHPARRSSAAAAGAPRGTATDCTAAASRSATHRGCATQARRTTVARATAFRPPARIFIGTARRDPLRGEHYRERKHTTRNPRHHEPLPQECPRSRAKSSLIERPWPEPRPRRRSPMPAASDAR